MELIYMNIKKKGGISTVVATIIGILILTTIFYHYFFINLDLERYNLINQYTRDMLLIAETKDYLEKDYFLNAKNKLSDRIVKKDKEYVKIYVTVNGIIYDVDSMPSEVETDYGETIEILTEYHYEPQRLVFEGLFPVRDTGGMKVMGVKLTTISKNRGTSDGSEEIFKC